MSRREEKSEKEGSRCGDEGEGAKASEKKKKKRKKQ